MLSITSCSNQKEEPLYTLDLSDKQNAEDPTTATTGSSGEMNSELVFEITPTLDSNMKSGKLVLTISNPRVINNATEIENLNGLFDSIVPVYDQAGEHIYKHNSSRWPSFIQENGNFVDGVHLILIDVSVQSIDAHMRTIYDTDENGLYAGSYADPYILRSDQTIGLADLSGKVNNSDAASVFSDGAGLGTYKTWYQAYFSRSGECSEHPAAYYLEPGESIEYTVGYLIGNRSDGSDYDLSELYLTVDFAKYIEDDSPSIDKTYYIKLGLGE